MEVTFFVILGVLLLVSLGLQGVTFYWFRQDIMAVHRSIGALGDLVSATYRSNNELNDKILSVSNENVRLTSELTSLRAINEDLNKSLDILTQQHLS